jgi:hypothetical protein
MIDVSQFVSQFDKCRSLISFVNLKFQNKTTPIMSNQNNNSSNSLNQSMGGLISSNNSIQQHEG